MRPRIAVLAAFLLLSPAACHQDAEERPIRLGILHSLTGPHAFSEKRLVDAEILAIEEINAAGGVLGRRIEPVIADGQSDSAIFAREAESLIKNGVRAIAGCAASSDRRTVLPVIERYGSLLLYPSAYEGLEESPHLVSTGGTANQQTIPAVRWFLENRGRDFFLVGSDDVWAHAENAIIKDQLARLGGRVVGEEYLPLDVHDTSPAVKKIAAVKPDVIINSLSHGIVGFFQKLRAAGVDPRRVPTFSLAVGEDLLRSLRPDEVAGSYAAWPYFESQDSPANKSFTQRFKARYGAHRHTDDHIHNAYIAVRLWAQAVEDAETDAPEATLRTISHQTLDAPGGRVWVDEENRHLWRRVRIGRIRPDRQFDIVWTSEVDIRPQPYPVFRTRREWVDVLQTLYRTWHNNWFRPPGTSQPP
ncbi:urea ABC transporter substrate-binding protein [Actinomadura rudentiformis]|uniref:Transporter substrate-binding protein n=1 Tax=Actinomadura rudentiformis TaxID=359158 RepID=A0A6H9Z555_9ACTN|nr:urea ABC transporter substrate-binding protein [Actinomadura rudentiformis]KAB2352398.1 transporter substrate-binding protein [Actinomadura rudentiformis]